MTVCDITDSISLPGYAFLLAMAGSENRRLGAENGLIQSRPEILHPVEREMLRGRKELDSRFESRSVSRRHMNR